VTRKCLCCGENLLDNEEYEWHKKCIKKFFGVSVMPTIDLKYSDVSKYTSTMLDNKNTLTGVQEKMSLHLDKISNVKRLTLIGSPMGYILKPGSKDYPQICVAEYLVMNMALKSKIDVCPFALIRMKDQELAYISKRIDRIEDNKVHMEDFCQLSQRQTEDKYNSSYERCAKVIDKYSTLKQLDKIMLFERIIFSFITLNSDMHLKNFSLIENSMEDIHLSKAYDLLPAKLFVKNDKEDLALTLNGKKQNLRKGDFLKYAKSIGIDDKASIRIIKRFVKLKDTYINMIKESYLSDDFKDLFIKELTTNIDKLI